MPRTRLTSLTLKIVGYRHKAPVVPSLRFAARPMESQHSHRGPVLKPAAESDQMLHAPCSDTSGIASHPSIYSDVQEVGAMAPQPLQPTTTVAFPPLPVFQSDTIRDQVFTHRSFSARPRAAQSFEDPVDDISKDNERLEHLGDTVLALVVADMILKEFPELKVGPATKTKAMVVGNPTLAEISKKYKLHNVLKVHPSQALALRTSPKIQADVLESFIGGLYLDQGLNAVKQWLEVLLPPYISAAYDKVRQLHGLQPRDRPSGPTAWASSADSSTKNSPPLPQDSASDAYPPPAKDTSGHLALLNQELQKQGRMLEWNYTAGDVFGYKEQMEKGKDNSGPEASTSDPGAQSQSEPFQGGKGTQGTPVWTATLVVDREEIAVGRGISKKAARNAAAVEGLFKLQIQF